MSRCGLKTLGHWVEGGNEETKLFSVTGYEERGRAAFNC